MKTLILTLTLGITFICAKTAHNTKPAQDYAVNITDSGTYVYSGVRLVGFVPYGSGGGFDTLFLNDNL